MRALLTVSLCVAVCFPAVARADKAFLPGGNVLEGKITQQGDKIIVQTDDGAITLPADYVQKVETTESLLDTVDKRHAKLKAKDVKGRLKLADFCRDHELPNREKQLLREVLNIDENNATARARLGYVKTDQGWMAEADAMRMRGYVLENGVWMTREEAEQIERSQEEIESAARERKIAEQLLAQKRTELQQEEAEFQEQMWRARRYAPPPQAPAPQPATYGYGYGFGYGYSGYRPYYGAPAYDECTRMHPCSKFSNPNPFPIVGVRDPRDATWSVPGTKDPRRSVSW
jgi:hypothetical protein